MMRNLLLMSSSKTPTHPGWLDHARSEIETFLRPRNVRQVAFVPYAACTISYDDYASRMRSVFNPIGFQVVSVHEEEDPIGVIQRAEAVCIGGGNTYVLNQFLHQKGLRRAIRQRILEDGIPYVGWSAGSVVAFGGIETTNDMNVCCTSHFPGLALIEGSLRLNPHYLDAVVLDNLSPEACDAAEAFMRLAPEATAVLKARGETRTDRIAEYLKQKLGPVIGLYEGGILLVRDNEMTLQGPGKAKVFCMDLQNPTLYEPGANLSFLLQGAARI